MEYLSLVILEQLLQEQPGFVRDNETREQILNFRRLIKKAIGVQLLIVA